MFFRELYNFSCFFIYLYVVKFDCDGPSKEYSQVDATPGSFIVSPGYPNYYSNGLFCHIEVLIDHEEDIILYFQTFHMYRATSEACQYDYLYIMPRTWDQLKICGEATPEPIRLTLPITDILDLEFTSRYGQEPGFKIQLQRGKHQPHLTLIILRYYVSLPKYK